jgi:uncharacterized membrane protein YfcA
MLMTLWSHHVLQIVPWFRWPARHSAFFFAAGTYDILYKVGGGIVLSQALAASGLDSDWRQIVATSGEFQVFGGIF